MKNYIGFDLGSQCWLVSTWLDSEIINIQKMPQFPELTKRDFGCTVDQQYEYSYSPTRLSEYSNGRQHAATNTYEKVVAV